MAFLQLNFFVMISRILIPVAVCCIAFSACQIKKKTSTAPTDKVSIKDEPAIDLDTIRVIADVSPAKEIYRETNPRTSDILHTRLDVSFDWMQSRLNGTASIDLKQYFYSSEMLYLNARGMDIKSVKVYDLNLPINDKFGMPVKEILTEKPVEVNNSSYKYENDSLKISLGKVFTSNEKYRVVIEYVSKPNELKQGGSSAISSDKGLYFINPTGENPYKMPQVWTQGETQSSSAWFPTIDSPNEKMTQDIYMTVDEKYTTLSNGLLLDFKKNADGTRTDHWKLDQPHAPYLVMMAVGQFKKVTDEPWNGKEISYYVEKEYEPHAKGIFGDTKEMIEFYSKRLGVPYPWPKYAQIAVRDYVSGAMENTSATLHGDGVVYQTTRELLDGKVGEDVIAHELFHQWFGDLVTCESWSNLPLNESFATYGEYLWQEYKHGREAADHHHAGSRGSYLMSDKEVNLIRFNYEHREDMFDGFSYAKGGQILHMLRKAIGDDAFFASLKHYLETNKFKAAEIHNLRIAFEEVTGKDLNWFFNQWFLSRGRPKIKVNKMYIETKGGIELTVEQTQDFKIAPLYKLPVDIDVYVNGVAKRTRIWVTEQKQVFNIKTDGTPQLVNFDAERQLLCDMDYNKTDEEYVFQFKNTPLYEDKMEALRKLEEKLNDAVVFEMFKWAAENEKFAPVRNFAIGRLETAPAAKMAEVKALFLKVYSTDKNTRTRARALSGLNKKFGSDADIIALNEKALSDVSYAVNAEALESIAKRNPKSGMEKAKMFEGETAKDLIFVIANLYAEHGNDEQMTFFQNNLKYVTGFGTMTFIGTYAKTSKRFGTAEAALAAAQDFEVIAKGGNRFTKYPAVKGIKDLSNTWEGKERTTLARLEAAKKENKNVDWLEKELKIISQTKDALSKMYDKVK